MHSISQTVEFQRGRNTLTVAPELVGGVVRYVGRVDGRGCVSSPTREGAVQALLRRMCTFMPTGIAE
jgi:hypothetical protein